MTTTIQCTGACGLPGSRAHAKLTGWTYMVPKHALCAECKVTWPATHNRCPCCHGRLHRTACNPKRSPVLPRIDTVPFQSTFADFPRDGPLLVIPKYVGKPRHSHAEPAAQDESNKSVAREPGPKIQMATFCEFGHTIVACTFNPNICLYTHSHQCCGDMVLTWKVCSAQRDIPGHTYVDALWEIGDIHLEFWHFYHDAKLQLWAAKWFPMLPALDAPLQSLIIPLRQEARLP